MQSETSSFNDPTDQEVFEVQNTIENEAEILPETIKPKRRNVKSTQVSVAQYMFKNIHLLGFQNTHRVLNVALRQLMDNALDAANQAYMLPKIQIKIEPSGKKGYKLYFKDYGPGITPEEVPNICCRLLYGSKFSDIVPQRGQQGLGLTALILYSQKTRGKPARIITKTQEGNQTQFSLEINIQKNLPNVLKKTKLKEGNSMMANQQSGFYIELDLEAVYTKKGTRSTISLLEQYCYLNPNLTLDFEGPEDTYLKVQRVSDQISLLGEGVKCVPHHASVGQIQNLIKKNPTVSLLELLEAQMEGPLELKVKALEQSGIPPQLRSSALSFTKLQLLLEVFKEVYHNTRPKRESLVDLGPKIRKAVTRNETIGFDTILTVASEPVYYQKGALKVQACAFYGSPTLSKDQKIVLYRAANGTPLLYQAGVCCITRSIIDFDWKKTGLAHPQNELPRGNLILFVHVNSTKTPYVTESKDAIADLPQIRTAITLCLQKLSKMVRSYMKKEDFYQTLVQKKKIIQKVIPDMIETLKIGLNRPLRKQIDLVKLKAKILELVCFFEEGETVRCINGTKRGYVFEIKTNNGWLKVGLAPLEETIIKDLPVKSKGGFLFEVEGLTPVEYVVI